MQIKVGAQKVRAMRRYIQFTAVVMASQAFLLAYVDAVTPRVLQSASVIVEVPPMTISEEASVNALMRAEDWDDCQVYSVYHGRCNWKSL